MVNRLFSRMVIAVHLPSTVPWYCWRTAHNIFTRCGCVLETPVAVFTYTVSKRLKLVNGYVDISIRLNDVCTRRLQFNTGSSHNGHNFERVGKAIINSNCLTECKRIAASVVVSPFQDPPGAPKMSSKTSTTTEKS